jgi:transposase-like protein
LFRYSEKGDWVPVPVARDRNKHLFDECLDNVDTATLLRLLDNKIAANSVVCRDGFLSYLKLAKDMKVEHKVINASHGKRVKEGMPHIQNVNAYHSRLHLWMDTFRGAATKYQSHHVLDLYGSDSR